MSNNNVKDWNEFQKIAELSKLEELVFVGEIQCTYTMHTYMYMMYCTTYICT